MNIFNDLSKAVRNNEQFAAVLTISLFIQNEVCQYSASDLINVSQHYVGEPKCRWNDRHFELT